MHVLVATAGALSPEPVVSFARHLIGGTGSVTLMTVVEVPHGFLEGLSTDDWHPLHDTHAENGAVAAQYLEERGRRLTDPVRQALDQARIPCDVRVIEGGDPATAISEAAEALEADVVLLGATKQIFDRDAWESVSARVMLESGRPVLVVPEFKRQSGTEEHLDEIDGAVEPLIASSAPDADGDH